ncbi:MAG: exo-alpha-sialidase [Candidatus Eremiobacteraeota bacterium]|nr:exo-alpha-sialidase [Candidatus Eremiobacteraeota bacterium]
MPSARNGARAAPRFEREHLWGPADANHWEPVNAADPSSNWVYQMTTDQRPDYLLFRSSSDGGRIWSAPRHLCRRGVRVPFQYDPQIAVAADGTIDVICLDGFRPGVVFARSRDHGVRWSKAIRLDGTMSYSDKPTLVISPSGKDIYVSFNARYALYVASSHDYGATWTPAARATAHRYWYYSYGGAISPDGAAWFAVDGETGLNQTGGGHVELVTSSDGGTSWKEIPFAVTHEGARCSVKHCYPDFYTAQDAVASDRTGNLVFVFAKNDRRHGPNALYASLSNDEGTTWSQPFAINTFGNSTSPAVAAGLGTGAFRLVWQDDRSGPKSWNTWYAQSGDAGASWSAPVRLSDRGSGAPYKHGDGYDFPFGDYLGLSVDDHGVNHVIWGEGSAVYVPGGTWWTRGS